MAKASDLLKSTSQINIQSPTNSSEAPVQNTGAFGSINQIAGYDNGQAFRGGLTSSQSRPFDLSSYTKYNTFVNPNLPREVLDEQRALSRKNSAATQMLKNSSIQLLGTIAGEFLTGAGSILNIPQTIFRNIQSVLQGANPESWDKLMTNGLGSGLQQVGVDLKESARERFAVHLPKASQQGGFGGGLADPRWWFANIPTVGSAVASFIPVLGTVRGVSTLGKFAAGANRTTKIGRAASNLGRVLEGQRFQNVSGMLMGAHLDAMMEVAHGYDTQFQYAKKLGLSDDDSKKFAGEYAAEAYRKAWTYGFVFTGIELNSLLRGSNKIAKNIREVDYTINKNIQNYVKQGTRTITETTPTVTRRMKLNTSFEGLKDFMKVGLAEGIEEMRVDLALQEGELKAREAFGIYDYRSDMTQLERWNDYAKQTANWDSFIWGFIGGGTMFASRNLANKVAYSGNRNKYFQDLIATPTELIGNIASTIEDVNGDLSIQIESEERVNEDGTVSNVIKENGISAPGLTIFNTIFRQLADANAIQYAEAFLDGTLSLSEQELTGLYGENKRELVSEIRKELRIAKDIYAKNSSIRRGNKYDNYFNNNKSSLEYQKNYIQRELLSLRNKIKIAALDGSNQEQAQRDYLKTVSKTIGTYEEQIADLQKQIDLHNKNISDIERTSDKTINSKTYRDAQSQREQAQQTLDDLLIQRDNIARSIRERNTNYRRISQELVNTNDGDLRTILNASLNTERSTIDSERTNRRNINNQIRRARYNLAKVLTNTSIIDAELNNRNWLSEIERSDIQIIQNRIDYINRELSDYKESHPEESTLYNKEKSSLVNNPIYNLEVEALLALENALLSKDLQLGSILKNYESPNNIESKTNEIEKLYRLQQQEIKNSESDQEIDIEEQELNSEIESLNRESTERNIDSNDIEYTRNADGLIVGFVNNNHKYEVGDKIGSATITDIMIGEGNQLMIQLSGSETFNLLSDITFDTTSQEISALDALYVSFTNETELLNNPTKVLNSFLKHTKSKNYQLLILSNTDNNTVLEKRVDVLFNIKRVIFNAVEQSDNQNQEIINEFVNKIEADIELNKNKQKEASLTNYFNKLFNVSSVTNSSQLNDFYQTKLAKNFIKNLINIYLPYTIIENGNISYTSDLIIPQLNNIFYKSFTQFIEDIDSTIRRNFPNENIDNLLLTLNDNSQSFLEDTLKNKKELQKRISQVFSKQLQYIEHGLSNEEFDANYSVLKYYPITAEQIRVFNELSSSLKTYFNNFIPLGQEVLPSQLETLRRLALEIEPVLDYKNIDKIAKSELTAEQIEESQKLSSLGIFNQIYSINQALNYIERITEEQEETLSDDFVENTLQRVSEINIEGLPEASDFIDDTAPKNSYKYFIAPIYAQGFKALNDFINKYRSLDIYNPNSRITFDQILNEIYQSTNGETLIWDYYESIFEVFKLVSSPIYSGVIENIRNTEDGGEMLQILDNIKNNIATFTSVYSSPFAKNINSNGQITKKYIDKFIKEVPRTDFSSRVKRGLIIENVIDRALKESSLFDVGLNTIEEGIIEIDGTEFTVKEVIQAKEDLYIGKELFQKLDGQQVKLYTKVNGKDLLVGQINLTDTANFHGLPLLRSSNNSIVYDSAFGTENSLSKNIISLVNGISSQSKLFGLVKNYFTTYLNNGETKVNSDITVQEKLNKILDSIQSRNPLVYNAILNASNYNTENENTNYRSHANIKAILEPIFYRLVLDSIKDYSPSRRTILTLYNNINDRLYQTFITGQKVAKQIESNPNTTITISNLNKHSLNFNNNKRRKNNVVDSVKPTLENGENNIISRIRSDSEIIVSSITQNKQLVSELVGNESTRSSQLKTSVEELMKLMRKDVQWQFYVETKSFTGEQGLSTSPLEKGDLRTRREGSEIAKEFSILSQLRVADILKQFISDPNLYTYPESQRERDETKRNLSTKTRNLLDDLSEIIVVDHSSNSQLQFKWFNVNQTFPSRDGRISKKIEFITTDRNATNSPSYGYEIEVFYKKDSNGNYQPDSISFKRSRTKSDRFAKTKLVEGKPRRDYEKGFTPAKIKLLEKSFDNLYLGNTYVSIPINGKNTLDNIFSSEPVKNIIQTMVRATAIDFVNNAHIFTSKAKGLSYSDTDINKGNYQTIGNISKNNVAYETRKYNKYKSATFDWARQQGLTTLNPTFNSVQDFYLQTNALTTGLSPIRSSDGTILSNYKLDSYTPSIYINTEIPDDTTTIVVDKVSDVILAKNIIQDISTTIQDKIPALNKLRQGDNIPQQTLIDLGIIKNNTSEEIYKEINRFIIDTLEEYNTPIINVDNVTQLNQYEERKTRNNRMTKQEFDNTFMAFSPSQNAIYILPRSFKSDSSKSLIGQNLLHELLHLRVNNELKSNRLNQNVINDLNNIISELKLIESFEDSRFDTSGLIGDSKINIQLLKNNVKNLISKLEEAGSDSYTELISFVFTNPDIAATLNRIKTSNQIETKETFWTRLLNSILSILGIDVNDNSFLSNIRDIIANNVTSELAISSHPFPLPGPTAGAEVVNESSSTNSLQNLRRNKLKRSSYIQSDDVTDAGRGRGERTLESFNENILKLQTKSLSLLNDMNDKQREIESFKTNYKDNDNLKIC